MTTKSCVCSTRVTALAKPANSFASFLLDVPGTIQRDVKVIDQPGTEHWRVFAFAQDKWQVNQKLTVDLGLRWEYYTPFRGIEDQGGLSNYDPFSEAFVLSRGIVGSRGDVPKVASPVYKQSFDLRTGVCLEDPSVTVATFPVRVVDGRVTVGLP